MASTSALPARDRRSAPPRSSCSPRRMWSGRTPRSPASDDSAYLFLALLNRQDAKVAKKSEPVSLIALAFLAPWRFNSLLLLDGLDNQFHGRAFFRQVLGVGLELEVFLFFH